MIGNSYQTITLRRSRVVVSLPFLIRKALRPCQWWWGRRLNKQKITHAKGTKASKRTLAWSGTSGLGRSSISSARLHSYRPVLYVGQNCRACGLLHEHCCPRSTTDLETGPGLSLFGTSSPLRVRVHGVEWKQKIRVHGKRHETLEVLGFMGLAQLRISNNSRKISKAHISG
jgi:hypothetical protein